MSAREPRGINGAPRVVTTGGQEGGHPLFWAMAHLQHTVTHAPLEASPVTVGLRP